MKMFVNNLILIPCVKTTKMRICKNILTTSGYRNKIWGESDRLPPYRWCLLSNPTL